MFIIYNPKQKIDYRKIKRWKIRVNTSNNFYKNFEETVPSHIIEPKEVISLLNECEVRCAGF